MNIDVARPAHVQKVFREKSDLLQFPSSTFKLNYFHEFHIHHKIFRLQLPRNFYNFNIIQHSFLLITLFSKLQI